MDDNQPLKTSGGYNIDFNELDESTNPFDNSHKLKESPMHVGSKGDEPGHSGKASAANSSPVKGSLKRNCPDASPNGFSSLKGPQPEALSKALEDMAIKMNQPNGLDTLNTSGSSELTGDNQPPNLARIDSSTRPASPTVLISQPTQEIPHTFSSSSDSGEAEALRRERDDLATTVEEMRRCIAEYERSLQHLVEEKSQSQKHVNTSVADLVSERDQAIEEVATIEKAFGDLHRRFEKSKQVIDGYKQNEEALKRGIAEYKSLLERQEHKYLNLKRHAEEKLAKVAQDIENSQNEFQAHMARLQASLRIAELQIQNLETQLHQKTLENQELTKICDELLNKYANLT